MMTKLRAAIATAVIALGLATAGGVATSTPARADDDWGWRRHEQWREWQHEREWREREREREWRQREWRQREWQEREWRERQWRQGYYPQRNYWR